MKKPRNEGFKSAIRSCLQDFLDAKHQMGYVYRVQETHLYLLDDYWIATQGESMDLSREALEPWCMRRESEGEGSHRGRVIVTRQLALFLRGRGIACWIPDLKVKRPHPCVYVPSLPEIQDLFTQIDAWKPSHRHPDAMRIAFEFPVLFRLLASTGLRIGEALALKTEDVDMEHGVLHILEAKNRKDRLVYMADDMSALLGKYIKQIMVVFGKDVLWLFPGTCPGRPLSKTTAEKHFDDAWNCTPAASGRPKKPTLHCLRHFYVSMRIDSWIREGRNSESLLPYLARQLGHASPAQTYNSGYYHQLDESLKNFRAADSISEYVIPEVPTT